MKPIQINTSIESYGKIDEMEISDQELMRMAIDATSLSYSPYSKFKVGAALRLANGVILKGANQENASYSLCLCAEQVVLHRASTQYPNVKIEAIAVTAIPESNPLKSPPPPCGACRQVLTEYEFRHESEIRVILGIPEGTQYIIQTVKDLLHLHFVPCFLKG